MSQFLQVTLSDEVFVALERQAAAEGSDPATVAAAMLQSHFRPSLPRANDAAAVAAFRAMFGTAGVGHPAGLDNDAIDADLLKDYSRGL